MKKEGLTIVITFDTKSSSVKRSKTMTRDKFATQRAVKKSFDKVKTDMKKIRRTQFVLRLGVFVLAVVIMILSYELARVTL